MAPVDVARQVGVDRRSVRGDEAAIQRWVKVEVFLDDSGLLPAPVVRRGRAPCGQTSILAQRGRARDTVSIIATL
jgi:hypothetical protein